VKVDQRLVVASLVVVAFAGGWAANAALTPAVLPPAGSPSASASATVAPSASAAGAQAAGAQAASAQAAGAQAAVIASAWAAPADSAAMESAFADIYKKGAWGKNDADAGSSGFGSTLRATAVYRAFLAQFMKEAEVRSVVDAGCGDWEFSQAIDWKGIDYKGYDIVPSVIEHDKQKFGKPGVQFFAANIVETDLPAADLLITKHVLQHLPNAAVQKFLGQLSKYKHVLIMSSVGERSLSGRNEDIAAGGFRALDITKPPFNVPGAKLLTYWDGGNMQQVVHVSRRP
jgi:SAM-dependent methyltransferase